MNILKQYYFYCVPQDEKSVKGYLFYKNMDVKRMSALIEDMIVYFTEKNDLTRLANCLKIKIELLNKQIDNVDNG